MNDETTTSDPVAALREALLEALTIPSDLKPFEGVTETELLAGRVAETLISLGHLVPGAPPANIILRDARQFAEKLTLSNLALRIMRMVTMTGIKTKESKATERWIRDYLDGKNHGPAGQPMLWPGTLPGLVALLREWGFVPTPGRPAYVARAPQAIVASTVQ